MPLTLAERKHRMPHGARREVARAEKVGESYVTAVMNGTADPKSAAAKKRVRRIQVALARKLRLPVEEVFPNELPTETTQEAQPMAAAS